MPDSLKDLIINLMFILLPLFLVQVLWLDRPNRPRAPAWWFNGIIGVVSAILCMTYPFRIVDGLFLDLRLVPMVISFVYGGFRSGLLTTALTLAYRTYLGGSGMTSSYITAAVVVVGYALFSQALTRWHGGKRTIAAAAYSLLGFMAIECNFALFFPHIFRSMSVQSHMLQFAAIQAAAAWIASYFIEVSIRNNAMRAAIEQSEKLKLVSELAASVSHEVRNPLTVTRGFIQLLRSQDFTRDKQIAYIDLAMEELNRAEGIISDYLSFAKPQMAKPDKLEVQQEIRYVADVIAPFATMNRVDVRLEVAGVCHVLGERDRFRQCLVNLAKNAVEAMPEGGSLLLFAGRYGSRAEIRVKDTGIGMTAEQTARLGTPYYSTKEKGTGLGTMVVYSVVKAMGGRIKVDSSPGAGTCFTLVLPNIRP